MIDYEIGDELPPVLTKKESLSHEKDGNWFVLRVERKHLRPVAEELAGYVPMMRRMTKPSRKKQAVLSEVPIFHSWCFIPYSHHNYATCMTLDGVRGIMKYGRMGVLFLRPDDMDRLREIEGVKQAETTPLPDQPLQSFSLGDSVTLSGLLEGMEGTVVGIVGAGWHIKVEVAGGYPITLDYCLLTKNSL